MLRTVRFACTAGRSEQLLLDNSSPGTQHTTPQTGNLDPKLAGEPFNRRNVAPPTWTSSRSLAWGELDGKHGSSDRHG